ncbi:MAG: SlyX family protein [Mariprofundus sp.]|nr:SlyX family protein [Mariprofundus sp.]
MQERLTELETKISYQEHTIAELNDVVTRQQCQIDQLEKHVKQLQAHLKQSANPEIARPEEEMPPPHY